MNNTRRAADKFGIALCIALLGCAVHGQRPISDGIRIPLTSVTRPWVRITLPGDFYEPLGSAGKWMVIGSCGRCWRPAGVGKDWRPYSNGRWQRTAAGWYWVSHEPWAWAVYHYGRWDYSDRYGWYWLPQIQWAPAWVSWHEGGGFVGWAPLPPSASMSANGIEGLNEAAISPRAFVFVKQDRFLDLIEPSIVVVDSAAIVKKTRALGNARIVNRQVINDGPKPGDIEKAGGRPVRTVAMEALRHKDEAGVLTRQQTAKGTGVR